MDDKMKIPVGLRAAIAGMALIAGAAAAADGAPVNQAKGLQQQMLKRQQRQAPMAKDASIYWQLETELQGDARAAYWDLKKAGVSMGSVSEGVEAFNRNHPYLSAARICTAGPDPDFRLVCSPDIGRQAGFVIEGLGLVLTSGVLTDQRLGNDKMPSLNRGCKFAIGFNGTVVKTYACNDYLDPANRKAVVSALEQHLLGRMKRH